MIIAHDPGHGGEYRTIGAAHNGIVERELVLDIARDVALGIPWVQHVLLRTTLDGPKYAERPPAAVRAKANFVICHHVNAYKDGSAHGLCTFFDEGDVLGKEVAEAIVRASPAALLRHPVESCFVTKPAPDWTADAHAVIGWYRSVGLSAMLIEWGYCTAAGDAEALRSPSVRPAMVAACAAGIARALELTHQVARPAA